MARGIFTIAACGLLVACAAGEVVAAPAEGFRRSLFNGENLDGWIVTGCEVAVRDGVLLLESGDGFVRTDHEYEDFVFEVDWRPLKASEWDSGIYFRAALPEGTQKWPARYQINLKQGDEGNVVRMPSATSTGLVKPGDWNHFKLTVIGDTAELEINGTKAWKTDGIEPRRGYLGLQSEVPLGGQYEFRDFSITELGYRPMFNGKDLTGWQGGAGDAADCWLVEDGLLVCTGKKGTWLRSDQTYGDFNLRLEYRIMAAGNSGVYLRVPSNGNHHGAGAGIEVQILDDADARYRELKPYQYAGSLYAVVPAAAHVGRPIGHWNSLEIDCQGKSYRVVHNGTVVIEADAAAFPELDERNVEGYLGLQNHNQHVWFRNLRLGPSQQPE